MKDSGAIEDGQYLLHISNECKDPVKVYCHGLSSNDPKEYLQLPAGRDRNYAIIFDQRLSTSPVRSRFQCDGPVSSNLYQSHGKTYFSKIRLNIPDLTVTPDDYAFADTESGSVVPYGTAGDCFSMNPGNCRKGSFMIDLTDTGLKVDDKVRWENQGYPSDIKIQEFTKEMQGMVISAKCGGWCGRCTPIGPLVLKQVCSIPESKYLLVIIILVPYLYHALCLICQWIILWYFLNQRARVLLILVLLWMVQVVCHQLNSVQ